MTLKEQFVELKEFLDRQGIDFLVVGGIAVQHYGYNRIAWLAMLNNLDPERDLREFALRYADEKIYQDVVRMIASIGGGK